MKEVRNLFVVTVDGERHEFEDAHDPASPFKHAESMPAFQRSMRFVRSSENPDKQGLAQSNVVWTQEIEDGKVKRPAEVITTKSVGDLVKPSFGV